MLRQASLTLYLIHRFLLIRFSVWNVPTLESTSVRESFRNRTLNSRWFCGSLSRSLLGLPRFLWVWTLGLNDLKNNVREVRTVCLTLCSHRHYDDALQPRRNFIIWVLQVFPFLSGTRCWLNQQLLDFVFIIIVTLVPEEAQTLSVSHTSTEPQITSVKQLLHIALCKSPDPALISLYIYMKHVPTWI